MDNNNDGTLDTATLSAIFAATRKSLENESWIDEITAPDEDGDPNDYAWRVVSLDDALDALDRIEAAAERERSKWERERRAYEKMHDCFWEKNAIQNIVRQMLDARDDLRRAYPQEADDLDYYAHELMEAAKKRGRDTAPGNAAALRSALKDTQDLLKHFTRNGGMLANAFALHMRDNDAALAAPARNIDRFATEGEAWKFYLDHVPDNGNLATGYAEWLFATELIYGDAAAEGGGAE